MAHLLLDAFLYVIVPLWLLAGFTDYVLHKRTHIEHTAGTRESLLHLLQLGEIGRTIDPLRGKLLQGADRIGRGVFVTSPD